MKKLSFLVLIFVASVSSAFAQPDLGKPYRVETFKTDGSARLEIKTSGGHIYLGQGKTDDVVVEMYVRKNNTSYGEGEVNLDDFTISIKQMGSMIHAIAKRENDNKIMNWGSTYSVHFIVYAPKKSSADIKTSGGHITLSSLDGQIIAKTSGGHIKADNISGDLNIATSGGNIEVKHFKGLLNAETSGGGIAFVDVAGDLVFKTSGGNINLEQVSGSIEGKTSGGNINAQINSISRNCELKTSGGNIKIQLPASEGFDIEAKGSRVSSNLSNFSGKTERDEISGTVRGGGSKVKLKTSGGSITLN